jgi:hypothetical protein
VWCGHARKRGGKASKRDISHEQVCILVVRDRSGNTCDFVTGYGPVTTAQLLVYLPPILAGDAMLVTDGLRRFHGVATRYLPNYLGWRWAIDQQRICSSEILLRAAIGVFHS